MTIYRFHHLGTARSFTDRCFKLHMVMHGDDGMFWVVTPADAGRLARQGYEYAA